MRSRDYPRPPRAIRHPLTRTDDHWAPLRCAPTSPRPRPRTLRHPHRLQWWQGLYQKHFVVDVVFDVVRPFHQMTWHETMKMRESVLSLRKWRTTSPIASLVSHHSAMEMRPILGVANETCKLYGWWTAEQRSGWLFITSVSHRRRLTYERAVYSVVLLNSPLMCGCGSLVICESVAGDQPDFIKQHVPRPICLGVLSSSRRNINGHMGVKLWYCMLNETDLDWIVLGIKRTEKHFSIIFPYCFCIHFCITGICRGSWSCD